MPARFADEALYARIGAIIKERATGRIVAHVQETSLWSLARHVAIPGANPLRLLTEGIQIFQLAKIQQTLNTVQTLATIGAVASVASLGVSVAGFSLVLARLGRMERKLDAVLAGSRKLQESMDQLHRKFELVQMAVLRAELESLALAVHYEAGRRIEALRQSIANLARLRHYYEAILADGVLTQVGTRDATALLDAHERLTAASEAELFAEFLLGSSPGLLAERWSKQQDTFNRVAWKQAPDLYDLLEAADKANGVYLVTPPAERTAVVKTLLSVREESLNRLASLPLLARELERRGLNPMEYLNAVEAAERLGEPLVAFVAEDA